MSSKKKNSNVPKKKSHKKQLNKVNILNEINELKQNDFKIGLFKYGIRNSRLIYNEIKNNLTVDNNLSVDVFKNEFYKVLKNQKGITRKDFERTISDYKREQRRKRTSSIHSNLGSPIQSPTKQNLTSTQIDMLKKLRGEIDTKKVKYKNNKKKFKQINNYRGKITEYLGNHNLYEDFNEFIDYIITKLNKIIKNFIDIDDYLLANPSGEPLGESLDNQLSDPPDDPFDESLGKTLGNPAGYPYNESLDGAMGYSNNSNFNITYDDQNKNDNKYNRLKKSQNQSTPQNKFTSSSSQIPQNQFTSSSSSIPQNRITSNDEEEQQVEKRKRERKRERCKFPVENLLGRYNKNCHQKIFSKKRIKNKDDEKDENENEHKTNKGRKKYSTVFDDSLIRVYNTRKEKKLDIITTTTFKKILFSQLYNIHYRDDTSIISTEDYLLKISKENKEKVWKENIIKLKIYDSVIIKLKKIAHKFLERLFMCAKLIASPNSQFDLLSIIKYQENEDNNYNKIKDKVIKKSKRKNQKSKRNTKHEGGNHEGRNRYVYYQKIKDYFLYNTILTKVNVDVEHLLKALTMFVYFDGNDIIKSFYLHFFNENNKNFFLTLNSDNLHIMHYFNDIFCTKQINKEDEMPIFINDKKEIFDENDENDENPKEICYLTINIPNYAFKKIARMNGITRITNRCIEKIKRLYILFLRYLLKISIENSSRQNNMFIINEIEYLNLKNQYNINDNLTDFNDAVSDDESDSNDKSDSNNEPDSNDESDSDDKFQSNEINNKINKYSNFDEIYGQDKKEINTDTDNKKDELIKLRNQELPNDELNKIKDILKHEVTDEIITTLYKIDITYKKINTLNPRKWIHSEIIDVYMDILMERDKKKNNNNTSHYFHSSFMSQLFFENIYNYDNVKKWSKKFDIFEKNKIYIPININNMHWAIAIIYMKKKEICYYDSLSGDGMDYLKALYKWIQDESINKKEYELPNENEWKLNNNPENVPQQNNGYDCGLFTIMCADTISDDLPLSIYSQEDMPMNRLKVAASIVRGHLLY